MRDFGLKHAARELARELGVPLLPGTGLLAERRRRARARRGGIGYPVMLKSTAGGGGIGMRRLRQRRASSPARSRPSSASGARNFKHAGVYLEKLRRARAPRRGADLRRRRGRRARARRARLLAAAAQPEGDRGDARAGPAAGDRRRARRRGGGAGTRRALPLGRHRRVRARRRRGHVLLPRGQHAPPGRARRHRGGHAASISSSGWCASRPASCRRSTRWRRGSTGAAIEVRLYAEDPRRQFQPSAGLAHRRGVPDRRRARRHLGRRAAPRSRRSTIRCSRRSSRAARRARRRRQRLAAALDATPHRRHRDQPRLPAPGDRHARVPRRRRAHPLSRRPRLRAGDDRGGRRRHADHGAGLSRAASATGTSACRRRGRWTTSSFRLANRLVGNADGAAGARDARWPDRRCAFTRDAVVALTRRRHERRRSTARPRRAGRRSRSRPAACCACRRVRGAGQPRLPRAFAAASTCRSTSAAARRSRSAASAATAGRALRTGRRAARRRPSAPIAPTRRAAAHELAARVSATDWEIGVLYGPHGAPDFFTAGRHRRRSSRPSWQVHYNSSRTGVRLIGPKPAWARARRRRGRPAPVEHPRQRLRDRHHRLHRRHAGDPRPRRPEPRRLRLPGDDRRTPSSGRWASSRPGDSVRFARRHARRGARAARGAAGARIASLDAPAAPSALAARASGADQIADRAGAILRRAPPTATPS